jgi:hypothetical protein
VYKEVQNNEEIPNISRSKLYNVLYELKFNTNNETEKAC